MKRSVSRHSPYLRRQLSLFRNFIFLLCAALLLSLFALSLLFLLPLTKSGKAAAVPAENNPRLSLSKNGLQSLPEESTPLLSSEKSAGEAPQSPSWKLTLVNAGHPMETGYVPPLSTVEGFEEQFDSRAIEPLQEMLRAMESYGLSPVVCSAYRTWENQEDLFRNRVQRFLDEGVSPEEAETLAAGRVARPGTSEHQLGLAADIVSAEYQLLVEEQENTPEQQWLLAHCAEYGFILRYPREKTSLTGIDYEPWHYRYVGEEVAEEITEKGLCLEEYLEQLPN